VHPKYFKLLHTTAFAIVRVAVGLNGIRPDITHIYIILWFELSGHLNVKRKIQSVFLTETDFT